MPPVEGNASNPVLLDMWQNIVGVTWDTSGTPTPSIAEFFCQNTTLTSEDASPSGGSYSISAEPSTAVIAITDSSDNTTFSGSGEFEQTTRTVFVSWSITPASAHPDDAITMITLSGTAPSDDPHTTGSRSNTQVSIQYGSILSVNINLAGIVWNNPIPPPPPPNAYAGTPPNGTTSGHTGTVTWTKPS